MSTETIDAQLLVSLDGKPKIQDIVPLPVGKHFEIKVSFTELPCDCLNPDPVAHGAPINWELTLDSLLTGAVVADRDHDDWVKDASGEWVHKNGPHLRSKSLAALWAPFTLVSPGATPS